MANEYATVALNHLLRDALPHLPGVVMQVAQDEFRLTLREFFEKSFAWTKTVKDVAVTTGETPIQVDAGDANAEVIGILNVAIGKAGEGYQNLIPLAGRPVNESTVGGVPSYFYITSNPDEFCLYPYMDAAGGYDLTIEVALIPDFNADASYNNIPRQILLKYYDAIMQGFLARMFGHPNKPYSAPLVAQQYRHNFLRAIGFYAAQRKSGYNGAQNWVYPKGWR